MYVDDAALDGRGGPVGGPRGGGGGMAADAAIDGGWFGKGDVIAAPVAADGARLGGGGGKEGAGTSFHPPFSRFSCGGGGSGDEAIVPTAGSGIRPGVMEAGGGAPMTGGGGACMACGTGWVA